MRPTLPDLLLRLAVASVLVLGLCHFYGRPLVQPLLPILSRTAELLEPDFTITAVDIAREGPGEVVRVRANLSHPIRLRGRVLQPFGTGTMPAGGFQVTLTLGGFLQYGQVLLILVAAWPAARLLQYALRGLIALPLLAVLLLLQGPPTVVAELWGGVYSLMDSGYVPPLMIWSRFLMGGGGVVLGLLFGALAIVLASDLAPSPSTHRTTALRSCSASRARRSGQRDSAGSGNGPTSCPRSSCEAARAPPCRRASWRRGPRQQRRRSP